MKQKSMDRNQKTGKILIEAGILIMVLNIVSSYGIWQAILDGWKISDGSLYPQAFINTQGIYFINYLNGKSFYLYVLSVVFSFLGNKGQLVPIINLIFQLFGILCFYYGTKRICSYFFSYIILFVSIIISIGFYPINRDTSMHLIWMLSGFVFWVSVCSYNKVKRVYGKYLLAGLLIGIGCYVDFAGLYLLATVLLLLLVAKEHSVKEKILQMVFCLLCVVNGYFIMFYLWNNFTFNLSLFEGWVLDKAASFYTLLGLYENIALGVLLFLVVLFSVFQKFQKKEVIDEKDSREQIHTVEHITKMQEAEEDNSTIVVNYIPNPLPLPKKHVKKEMTYAFEPTKEQMHFDLNNYNVEDDYDLKDNHETSK